jgi:hypothetical protein
MTPQQFGRIIDRRIEMKRAKLGWRCSYPFVVFVDPQNPGTAAAIAGAGPNQERALGDLAQKISGKVARTYGPFGTEREFVVPHLTASGGR